ncbi:hypothetical protein OCU04_004955 [Sclerotinia nivalis]|uniref:Uncharacterized protein n=1 Tax=Sclerotinia nivalis TaxID=352851 RepID=A0A9X0DJG8_9HELO|nr:hypothetical protein OCU04_004955 [Sclerotinia nivalis]
MWKASSGWLRGVTVQRSSLHLTMDRFSDTCASVTENWTNSTMHEADPTSMMSPIYQGLTCVPTTDPTATCTLGGYPAYSVNATNVAQI